MLKFTMKLTGLFKFVLGLVFIVASLASLYLWWWGEFLTLLKGGLPVLVFLVGLLFLLLGFEE